MTEDGLSSDSVIVDIEWLVQGKHDECDEAGEIISDLFVP